MNLPPINWFGGMLIARSLLEWTKGGHDDDDAESFINKTNRPGFLLRAMTITRALNALGPTLEAAQMLQGEGRGYFTDVSAEALADKLAEAVEKLRSGGLWKFRIAEFGTLDFQGMLKPQLPPDATD